MENSTDDLWPEEIDIEKLPSIITPISILKEQASLLGQKTKNIVEAEVKSTDAGNSQISVTFNLVAPALNKYRYQLFCSHYFKVHCITLHLMRLHTKGKE